VVSFTPRLLYPWRNGEYKERGDNNSQNSSDNWVKGGHGG